MEKERDRPGPESLYPEIVRRNVLHLTTMMERVAGKESLQDATMKQINGIDYQTVGLNGYADTATGEIQRFLNTADTLTVVADTGALFSFRLALHRGPVRRNPVIADLAKQYPRSFFRILDLQGKEQFSSQAWSAIEEAVNQWNVEHDPERESS